MRGRVRLLNASYEPLGGVSFQHAVGMLVRGVATVEEQDGDRTIGPYRWPVTIRLVRFVAATWLYRPAGFSKAGVLVRDHHTCAFCGQVATTVDHVRPRSQGGPSSWLNCVAACQTCNGRKANRTPYGAGMRRLHATPYVPRVIDLVSAA
ncbi:MAG: HNH endonuclease [Actinomycetia bacterium]|nr:HNH endonuclease [Actinomycetes bacterium]